MTHAIEATEILKPWSQILQPLHSISLQNGCKAKLLDPDKPPLRFFNYGPLIWALRPFREILNLEGTYKVFNRYVRIPGLGAHGCNLEKVHA